MGEQSFHCRALAQCHFAARGRNGGSPSGLVSVLRAPLFIELGARFPVRRIVRPFGAEIAQRDLIRQTHRGELVVLGAARLWDVEGRADPGGPRRGPWSRKQFAINKRASYNNYNLIDRALQLANGELCMSNERPA